MVFKGCKTQRCKYATVINNVIKYVTIPIDLFL